MKSEFEAGVEALGGGDWKTAHHHFDVACKEKPDPWREGYRAWSKYQMLRHGAGGELRLTGVGKKNCKAMLHAAVSKAPDFDAGHLFLGRILLDEGDSLGAVDSLKKAVRLNGDNEEARRFLAQARRRLTGPKPTPWSKVERWFADVRGRIQSA